ncbi:MAG: Rod shape-determining protein RodA, partial [Cyanobacteriota bacterium]
MLSQLGRRNPRFFSGRSSRRNPLADVDLILWGVPLAMVAIAGILIASTQRQANYADWYQHWVTAAVGVVVAVVGTSALGAQSWINIGGFYVQPSEFAKVGAILLLAGVLARHPVDRPVDLIRPVGLIALPWLLVFVQPDLGSSLVFGAVLLVMLFWAGMPGAWVVLLLSPLVAA